MTTLLSDIAACQTKPATSIPTLSHHEAGALAATEAERLLAQIESLDDEVWSRPTDCSEWDVRTLVSHLAGAIASQASWEQFKRQNVSNPYLREANPKIDGINRRQVEDRVDFTRGALIAEFKMSAPKAVQTRQRLPWLLRALRLPFGPPLGFASIGYMMDTIYTRDQWMHRLDLARAADQSPVLTPEHDGRIVDLVILDLGKKLQPQLQGRTVDLSLDGFLRASYRFGKGTQADATIKLDFIEFNRLASGRLSPESAHERATISGNQQVAIWFLNNAEVPY